MTPPPPPPPPTPPPTSPPPRALEVAWTLYLAVCSALSVVSFLRHAIILARREAALDIDARDP